MQDTASNASPTHGGVGPYTPSAASAHTRPVSAAGRRALPMAGEDYLQPIPPTRTPAARAGQHSANATASSTPSMAAASSSPAAAGHGAHASPTPGAGGGGGGLSAPGSPSMRRASSSRAGSGLGVGLAIATGASVPSVTRPVSAFYQPSHVVHEYDHQEEEDDDDDEAAGGAAGIRTTVCTSRTLGMSACVNVVYVCMCGERYLQVYVNVCMCKYVVVNVCMHVCM